MNMTLHERTAPTAPPAGTEKGNDCKLFSSTTGHAAISLATLSLQRIPLKNFWI
jgi:hypothetical protein